MLTVKDSVAKFGLPPMAAMSGVMMSAISAWITALKATPMTTATARSMRLPRRRNFLKPPISPSLAGQAGWPMALL